MRGGFNWFLSLMFFAGCAGPAQEVTRSFPERPAKSFHQRPYIVPGTLTNPSSNGVAGMASEQFLLCRRKDVCPVPKEVFTERVRLPEPVREEPLQSRRGFKESITATVFFDEGDVELDDEGLQVLDRLLGRIHEADPLSYRIIIAGYTDDQGSEEENGRIAWRRAETVASYLKEQGLPAERLVIGGRPRCCYLASNETDEGRARNRRAEVFVEPTGEVNGESR
jgi:OOP family OmpA-OmpF porin